MRKFHAVIAEMEKRMKEGHYRPGDKLPSVRSAAEFYSCSVSTILRAYAELERTHVIYSIPQSGYYVVGKTEDSGPAGGRVTTDLASASPDLNVFPYLDFQHCLNKAIDQYKYHLFTYGDALGLDTLRRTLVSHLAEYQVFAKAERIIVTSGIQQALEILARMPFPGGRTEILVEQPGYDIYLRYLEAEGLPVSGISRSAAGINLRELEEQFASGRFKFFYTMPRYHNPLGTSYSPEERKAIAGLAGKYDVYIAEDDYMADLGTGRHFNPVYAYDQTSRVIYMKSFSKIIFPGLRLGAVVLPEPLLETFRAYKGYTDTSLLSQAALEVYIKNGMYGHHRHNIKAMYAKRIQAVYEALQRHNTEGLIEASADSSGIYMQFKLPVTVNLERLVKRLDERGISVVPGNGFYVSGYRDRDKFIRISISRAGFEQIDAAVAAIIQEVKRGSGW
ncbi:PLP-dependent aminotransferase family protein [Paenibacillus sp. MMS20-IR301]|uniref:aminotransferase-like domain-containing protein n=1 Tax=Paenibacillus sp. MMS20-IR301 TaxID=2895946 RepID=UPI0028E351F2|nr:PLP-dependent aminotransferase family protein [Paenibacillus sp. MMS20-IR301]WNS41850.1 PLP-dependent aminotransferase family protein [Paenibacillus sp. MMS20-IR301]